MSAAGVISTLQKLATALERLDDLTDDVGNLQRAVTDRMERLEAQVADVRERLVRMETMREADFTMLQAEVARFRAEAERAELQRTKQLRDRPRSRRAKGV